VLWPIVKKRKEFIDEEVFYLFHSAFASGIIGWMVFYKIQWCSFDL
jgi:hypothetical protein